MKENRIKVVSPGFMTLFYLMMQQLVQKLPFLHIGHMRKSQIVVIIPTNRQNNILTLKCSILQQIKNKGCSIIFQMQNTLGWKINIKCF